MSLVHLDKQLGLSIMGGNEDLYNKFLSDFIVSNKNKSSELMCLYEEDLSAFKREIHTIKGQAGNIGAQNLQRLAQELEESFSSQKLNDLCEELALLCNESYCVSIEEGVGRKAGQQKIMSADKINELFKNIEFALSSGKPLLARKSITQLVDIKLHQKDQKLVEEISILVSQYQMKSAYDLVQIRKSNYY